MKTLRATAAEDLLDIIMRRHEHLPTVITTNRPTQDWAHFLGDVPAATAILDRFLHHIEIVLMQGRSYRLASQIASEASKPTSPDTVEPVTPVAHLSAPEPADDDAQAEPPKSRKTHSPGATLPPTSPAAPPRTGRAASPATTSSLKHRRKK